MSFKYPALLWGLLVILIPIVIHLFRWRRFQKTPFTNVAFLEKVTISSRKSNVLKKWLLLLTRTLLFTALVLAFAHPYISKSDLQQEPLELVFYLDNSFSMQAETPTGNLLEQSKQNLVQHLPSNYTFSLFTNDNTWRSKNLKQIKNDLLNIPFSSYNYTFREVVLKAASLFEDSKKSRKKLVILSDFQDTFEYDPDYSEKQFDIELVKFANDNPNNISIDSVYILEKAANTLDINVAFSGVGDYKNIPVSLYEKDKIRAKGSVSILNNKADIQFNISNNEAFHGSIEIADRGLKFDNQLYFNLEATPKIKVLVIYDKTIPLFLKRIYTEEDFDLKLMHKDQINFTTLSEQHTLILFEIQNISNVLIDASKDFVADKKHIVIVPSATLSAKDNKMLSLCGLPTLNQWVEDTQKVTKIHYEHPLFSYVFDKRTQNFDYPQVYAFYETSFGGNSILSYQDHRPFLLNNQNSYLFTTPLNTKNTNFQSSPLIVPVFYKIGKESFKQNQLFYWNKEDNQIDIKRESRNNNIITLEKDSIQYIPIQQNYHKKVRLAFKDFDYTGTFDIKSRQELLGHISFNASREESNLIYTTLDTKHSKDLKAFLNHLKSEENIISIWKWFLTFALLCFVVEQTILKLFR